ncbi:RICIN domain-containing protein [Streptomyces sp. NPDC001002]
MATAVALCVLAATVVWTLVFAPPAGAEGAWRNLANVNSGRCLAVPTSSKDNGTPLVQWTCDPNDDEDWGFTPVPGGNGDRYRVVNRNSGQCIAIPHASTTEGVQAVQWPCSDTGTEQVWIYDSWNRLRNLNSDLCLSIPGSSTANGAAVVQSTCSTSTDQRWTWYDQDVVSARLYNMATGFCLADSNSDAANGAVMIQWACSNSASNYWSLEAVTGGYQVSNKASGKCLTPVSTALGAKVAQQPCSVGTGQVWIHDSWDRLRNVQSDYCLAIPSSSPTPGTEAVQWTCTDNVNEQWLW